MHGGSGDETSRTQGTGIGVGKLHSTGYISLQKQVDCFNHRVVKLYRATCIRQPKGQLPRPVRKS